MTINDASWCKGFLFRPFSVSMDDAASRIRRVTKNERYHRVEGGCKSLQTKIWHLSWRGCGALSPRARARAREVGGLVGWLVGWMQPPLGRTYFLTDS